MRFNRSWYGPRWDKPIPLNSINLARSHHFRQPRRESKRQQFGRGSGLCSSHFFVAETWSLRWLQQLPLDTRKGPIIFRALAWTSAWTDHPFHRLRILNVRRSRRWRSYGWSCRAWPLRKEFVKLIEFCHYSPAWPSCRRPGGHRANWWIRRRPTQKALTGPESNGSLADKPIIIILILHFCLG